MREFGLREIPGAKVSFRSKTGGMFSRSVTVAGSHTIPQCGRYAF
jgi:hypothetical protein